MTRIREFRKLKTSDHAEVLALVNDIERQQGLSADFYWPHDELQAELWTTEGWGVFLNGNLAGFILYRVQVLLWEITVVVSAPHERRQGLMRGLLQTILNAASQEQPPGFELWLEVHARNTAAQSLYERLGFRFVGQRPKYYRDGATALLYSFTNP